MYVPRKVVLALAAVAALVFALSASGRAREDGNGETLLKASLAPSVPTDAAVDGVTPGGVPWVLDRGTVRLKADGELDLELRGLVIPSLGTAGPVTTVSASLLCADGTRVSTGTVPLSAGGDARIEATLALPAACLAPAVVVNPNGGVTRYIAVSGWKS